MDAKQLHASSHVAPSIIQSHIGSSFTSEGEAAAGLTMDHSLSPSVTGFYLFSTFSVCVNNGPEVSLRTGRCEHINVPSSCYIMC